MCRGNHCQLAQNKSNTSLVPDNTGFVRVPVPVCLCMCVCIRVILFLFAVDAAAAFAHSMCRVKSRPSLSHVHLFRNDADIHVQFLRI